MALLTAASGALVPGGLVASRGHGEGTASTLEVTIRVEVAPPEASRYFWAQQFHPASSAHRVGYFGIQSSGNIAGRPAGRLFIFSIWNATAAEAGAGATAQRFGGEGTGYSVRLPYDWKEGAPYRFRLEKDGSHWWRLTVSEKGSDPFYVGRIRITEDAPLAARFVSFTEYFGEVEGCAALGFARAAFEDLRFGAQRIDPADNAPYGRCATSAKGWRRGGAAVHEVGGKQ
jgi:hypothetical protein